ncbi:hypothetical protein U1Q18_027242, partial [Sarracenia purpurea var. burkii]
MVPWFDRRGGVVGGSRVMATRSDLVRSRLRRRRSGLEDGRGGRWWRNRILEGEVGKVWYVSDIGGVEPREAEIDDFDAEIAVEEDVVRLDVAVDDVGGVEVSQCVDGFYGDVHADRPWERAIRGSIVVQLIVDGAVRDVFVDEEEFAALVRGAAVEGGGFPVAQTSYGFTGKQISMLTMRCPRLYGYNAPKTLKPKLDYIKSLGLSDVELAQILSIEPQILERSLENRIMPSVQFIRHVVGTEDNVLKAIKAYSRLLRSNIEKELEPNIAMLISQG